MSRTSDTSTHSHRIVAVLIAVVAAASGVAAIASAPASASPSTPPGVPAGLTKCTQALAAWCGTLEVPLDRSGRTPGTVTIGFQYYPARETTRPTSTLVAHEGGPGYATTDSSDYFLDLFDPLMDTRAALLVDERGTGLSDPIDCSEAQSYVGDWVANATLCGEQLGDASDLYTTANAADDMADVLDSLRIDTIDLYGDSYGSFFAQTFTARYPDRVRAAIFDGTYPITGLDPWYASTADRLRDNLQLFCSRSLATCPVRPNQMLPLLGDVLDEVRREPVRTSAPDYLGVEVPVTLTPRRILDTLLYTDVTPGYVRAVPAALVSFTRDNPRPLARMVAEVEGASTDAVAGKMGIPRPNAEIRSFSEGAYLAYACSDYPQLWDKSATPAARQRQFDTAVADLAPSVTTPWTPQEWASSDFFVYDYCIGWPEPDAGTEPPLPVGAAFPDTPVLVLNGDLDLRTDVYQAREVARSFPNSTYVEVPNFGHVTALADPDACASAIARRFIETLDAGDTSCTEQISEHRVIAKFPEYAHQMFEAQSWTGSEESTNRDRRAAYVAVETVADVVDRWYAIPGYTGTSLYGGQFSMYSTYSDPFTSRVWSLKLNHLRWVRDIQVTGTGTIPRGRGLAQLDLSIRGAGTAKGQLTVTWRTRKPLGIARITGTIGEREVNLFVPAPSYY